MNAFVEYVKAKAKSTSKESTTRNQKKKAVNNNIDPEAGVVYIGHIPRGFFEKEMQNYFSQFGHINRLRLVRSPKTGGSKGYAFIEFQSKEVAQIVADTMNNYLFFDKLLQCQFIPSDKVHPNLFGGWKPHMGLRCDRARRLQNRVRSGEQLKKSKKTRLQRLKSLRSSLKESGISFKIKPVIHEK